MLRHIESQTVLQKIAHVSDLHIGYIAGRLQALIAIRDRLRELRIDHVLVTGDVTEHGSASEFRQFKRVFAEFSRTGRLTVLPGNHDRTGQDIARQMHRNKRVVIVRRDGLHLVVVDSTGPHNRYRLLSHGKIDQAIIDQVDQAVAMASPGSLVIVALHHHVMPQAVDYWIEKMATIMRFPFAKELHLGQSLVQRLLGRCDLILHGHRHKPMETRFVEQQRSLTIYNSGSSTELGAFRVFTFQNGKVIGDPVWCSI